MEKKAANKYLLSEEGRKQSLLNCGNGNTIQMSEAGINDRTNKKTKIYEMESIRTIGQGMKKLMPNGMFYILFAELKGCCNLRIFEQFMVNLSVSYFRFCSDEGLLSIEEIQELLKLAEEEDNIKTIVTAIMLFSACD